MNMQLNRELQWNKYGSMQTRFHVQTSICRLLYKKYHTTGDVHVSQSIDSPRRFTFVFYILMRNGRPFPANCAIQSEIKKNPCIGCFASVLLIRFEEKRRYGTYIHKFVSLYLRICTYKYMFLPIFCFFDTFIKHFLSSGPQVQQYIVDPENIVQNMIIFLDNHF